MKSEVQHLPVASFGVRCLEPTISICKICPATRPRLSSREFYVWRGFRYLMNTKDFTRFMSHVNASETCWEWKAGRDKDGYGNFYISGKYIRAHRASFEHFKGDIGNLIVTHSCDNPACVSPNHLFLGTHKSNADERQARGRGNQPKGENHYLRKHPEKVLKREKHPQARLTADNVREIRRLSGLGSTNKELAEKFGVTGSYIKRLKTNKNWKDV